MKHEHRFVVPVEGSYSSSQHVLGFSVYGRSGDFLAPDQLVHQTGAQALSYNWLFRKLIGAILFAEATAADFVRAIPDNTSVDAVVSGTYSLPYVRDIDRVVKRSNLSMPLERRFPELRLQDGELQFNYREVEEPDRRACKLTLWADLLGHHLPIDPPYVGGEFRTLLTPTEGEHVPIGGFHRLEIAGIEVPASMP